MTPFLNGRGGLQGPQCDPLSPPPQVLGYLADIRAYASGQHAAGRDEPQVPRYLFASSGSRGHCIYEDAADGGLPVPPTGIALNITGPHPGIRGPTSVFSPAAARVVRVSAVYDASLAGGSASLVWRVLGTGSAAVSGELTVPYIADGAEHTYTFDLSSNPAWRNAAAITQILFQPLGSAPTALRGGPWIHVLAIEGAGA